MTTTKSGFALQARPFSSIPTLIPQFVDGKFTGNPYKAELVLFRGPAGGARMHVWFAPDPRPHNHPWLYIDCKVLHGEYKSLEYVVNEDSTFVEKIIHLTPNSPMHHVVHQAFHQVVEVSPGTISIMSFGQTLGDGKQWGNLVIEDKISRYEPNSLQPGFLDALRHLNPHIRPIEWEDPYKNLPVPDVNSLMEEAGL